MPSRYNLSEGILQTIMKGSDVPNPVFQVLGSKKISSGSVGKDRYRLLLSDGKYTISFAMLTTQLFDQIGGSGITNYTVIRVKKYITSVINNNASSKDQRVLLIMDLDVVAKGEEIGETLGSPVALTDDASKNESSTSSKTVQPAATSKISNATSTTRQSNGDTVSFDGQIIHPISSLSPYQNRWIIKARVTSKSTIRTWSNSRGEGKLFSMELLDESGEIRCTGFKDQVDKFYDYVQVDKVYFISKCILKAANKQFSSLKNDYEMTMTNDTVFQECEAEDTAVPQTKYDFITIDKIAHMEVGTIIDVIGICKNVSELQIFQAKSSGRELKKKEVSLVDQSNTCVALTLWGAEAENFDGTNEPVLLIKGAKVGEFGGGKNLSTSISSVLKMNPDIPESFRIRGWYDQMGNQVSITNISARSGASGFNTPWLSFKEVRDQGLGNGDKGDYYQTMGTILLMRGENIMYKACPTEACNKKIIDMENGMYRCEKCNREYPNFKYRLLATMNVADWSGNQWVSMFSSEAETILGMTAQQVGEQVEGNNDGASSLVATAHFKQFIFKCRAKLENYNDEARLKTVAVKVEPINYNEFNAQLINRIKQLVG